MKKALPWMKTSENPILWTILFEKASHCLKTQKTKPSTAQNGFSLLGYQKIQWVQHY